MKTEKSASNIYYFKLEKQFCTAAEVSLMLKVPPGQQMLQLCPQHSLIIPQSNLNATGIKYSSRTPEVSSFKMCFFQPQ